MIRWQATENLQRRGAEKGFKVSRFQGFKVSRFQGFKVSRFQGFKVSRFQGFRVSGFQGFRGFKISSSIFKFREACARGFKSSGN
jgi:hypothetical protein